jgi:hypothetical protein
MASYTMELREALATFLVFDGVDVSKLSTTEMIEQGRQKLFNFDYEIFDPNYKAVWETNFIRNFFFREIGFETEDLFQFQLETWLRINMPYFNKLFTSETLKFDPLMNATMDTTYTNNKDRDITENKSSDRDTTRTKTETINGTENTDVSGTEHTTGNDTQSNSGFSRHLESETPDNRLSITTADGSGVIEYASFIGEDTNNSSGTTTKDDNTTRTNNVDTTTTNNVDGTDTDKTTITDTNTNKITDVESYVSNRVGKTGDMTYSEMVMKYRESFIRIEKRMYEEMQQLFMLVY